MEGVFGSVERPLNSHVVNERPTGEINSPPRVSNPHVDFDAIDAIGRIAADQDATIAADDRSAQRQSAP